jgi:hypothetical protein
MEARGAIGGSARVRLAALTAFGSALACFLLIALGSPGAEAGSPSLEPDLVTLGIGRHDIVVEKRGKHRFLRLSNTIGNRGSGPLDVIPAPPTGECDSETEFNAVQRLFDDTNMNGEYDPTDQPGDEIPFGCMRFHDAPSHLHWHVLDFARYELRRARTGKRIDSQKVGFCVIDTERPFPTLPGSPKEPQYPGETGNGCGGLDDEGKPIPPDSEGLSIGWADVYFFGLPGQSLDITKLRRGRYCLISTADPTDLIAESNEANNAHTVRLKMRPRKLRFKKLDGPCRF